MYELQTLSVIWAEMPVLRWLKYCGPPWPPADYPLTQAAETFGMAEAKDCPKCGLVNPPEAQRCDCGWDFVSRRKEQSYLEPKHRVALAAGIGVGVIVAIIVVRLLIRLLASAAIGQ